MKRFEDVAWPLKALKILLTLIRKFHAVVLEPVEAGL